MDRRELGQKGEAVAAKYYLNQGYRLLAHNYRIRMGELDLVLIDGKQLVVAEVKTRSDCAKMQPAEAVHPHKQRRLALAAEHFIQQYHLEDSYIRFDVVEVMPGESGWKIHCIKNAFEI